jgi:hypothetical protein
MIREVTISSIQIICQVVVKYKQSAPPSKIRV